MSMNPAQNLWQWPCCHSFWGSLWIYFVAPPLGMLVAAALYLRLSMLLLAQNSIIKNIPLHLLREPCPPKTL